MEKGWPRPPWPTPKSAHDMRLNTISEVNFHFWIPSHLDIA